MVAAAVRVHRPDNAAIWITARVAFTATDCGMTGYERSPDYGGPEPRRWHLPLYLAAVLLVSLLGVWHVLAAEGQICPKYGSCVPAKAFECHEVTRSSFIWRVCYNEPKRYLIIQLGDTRTDYHYCAVEPELVAAFLSASSLGRFYNRSIKSSGSGRAYDCRDHPVPSFN